MQLYRLSTIVFTVLMLTVSCNKEEEPTINPCMNGKLDAGETAVDCGGSCGPCPATDYPYAGFKMNGVPISASVKQLTYADGWSLLVGNDTVSLYLNLGNDGSVNFYPTMNPSGCSAIWNGVTYSSLTSGTYTINQHNVTTQKLSGFFDGNFIRPDSPLDTIVIKDGYFGFLPY